ncbi:MAG: sulfatase-like hydrolase/transferase [Opitutaceae bacterium]
MKYLLPRKLSVCILCIGSALSSALSAYEKPNILFIFADDMSYETIAAHGHLDIDTPNLDRLVDSGTSFTKAYNMGAWNGAVCVASRKMLNTGRFVWEAEKLNLDENVEQGRMWSQLMKQAGYDTYMTGKWHVSTDATEIFDVAKNIRKGMPDQTPQGYNRPKDEEAYKKGWKPWEKKWGGFWEGGKHWSEIVKDDALEYFETAVKSDNPFFMYIAFNAPHDPRQAPKEYIDRYPLDRIKVPESFIGEYPYAQAVCGKGLRDERLMPYPRTEYAVKVNRQEYFALITHMDDQIGVILDTLEASGKADNTYIFFTADHGLAVGHHGFVGKQNMYDDSVRVPFMVVGPKIKAGQKVDASIYLQDVVPTTLELAGMKKPDFVDFKSIIPLLRGERDKSYDSIYGAYLDRQRMITKNGWKLIRYPKISVDRLYDMNNDPLETKDLANNPEYASKLRELRHALAGLSKELGDTVEY